MTHEVHEILINDIQLKRYKTTSHATDTRKTCVATYVPFLKIGPFPLEFRSRFSRRVLQSGFYRFQGTQ